MAQLTFFLTINPQNLMFTKIYLTRLRNGEFIQFHKQTLAFVFSANPEQLGISDQYKALEKEWKELKQLFKKQKGSELTEEIELADALRDRLTIGSRTFFESFTYFNDPAKAEAGALLLSSMDKYGTGIARMNYQEESAVISSIINDWETDRDIKQALKLLKADEWREELKKSNEDFDILYRKRTEDFAEIPDETASALKKPVIEAYKALLSHITAHATLAEDKSPYERLIDLLNSHIDQYNQLLKSRGNYGTGDESSSDGSVQNEY